MEIYNEQKAYHLFTKNKVFDNDTDVKIPQDLHTLIDECLNLLNHPIPPLEIQQYFYNNEVLSLLLVKIWNDLSYDKRKLLIDNHRGFKNIEKTLPRDNKKYRIRILNAKGIYPNRPFSSDDSIIYTNINSIPILITKESKDESFYDSEISIMNTNELIASIGVILNSPRHRLHFSFSNDKTISISNKLFQQVNEQLRTSFVFTLLSLLVSISFEKKYTFVDHSPDEASSMSNFFKTVEKTNKTFLRTAFLTVKSQMLWDNASFGEDAIANISFALEGSLHLIQEVHEEDIKKLNLNKLEKIFKENFNQGEELFEFIKELYDKRTEIVHPVTDQGSQWCPSLSADDYYEYYEIVLDLLNYYVKKAA